MKFERMRASTVPCRYIYIYIYLYLSVVHFSINSFAKAPEDCSAPCWRSALLAEASPSRIPRVSKHVREPDGRFYGQLHHACLVQPHHLDASLSVRVCPPPEARPHREESVQHRARSIARAAEQSTSCAALHRAARPARLPTRRGAARPVRRVGGHDHSHM